MALPARRIGGLAAASLMLSEGCTNFMVSPGASEDGSTLMSYSCDGPPFAALNHYPARQSKAPAKRELTRSGCSSVGPVRGTVDDAEETYNVLGLTNEHAVAIGETTFGGIPELRGSGLLTYYDVMELALQRSKTAREMITQMDELIVLHGYGGTPDVTDEGGWGAGESFTIADTREAWHMELIGKGNYSTGAVWVACRVPDGHVGGHANQARITSFPLDDPETCRYSEDVVDFAVQAGLYPPDAPRSKFSFADAYDPISWTGARKCDARVWSFFSQVAEAGFEKRYENYVLGKNLTDRMPLFVKVARKVSADNFFNYMRNHYEGTALDDRNDVGAGPFHGTFRNSPSTWTSNGQTYVNERHVGVQYATTHYVAQLRGWLPKPIGALNWFSVDDATFSVHVPFHACSTRVPHAYSNDAGSADVFSFDSAFWVFNMVANFAYYRHAEVAPLVRARVSDYERRFAQDVAKEDARALELWDGNRTEAIEHLTQAGERRGNTLVKEWLGLYQQLFMNFRDGNTPHGVAQGYAQDWYDRVASETGDRYLMPAQADADLENRKLRVLHKHRLGEGSVPNSRASII